MRKFLKKLLAATATAACLFLPVSSQVDAETVARNPVQVTNARWYPAYHIAPYAGWANDPNGFCVYNGEYHFFYQHYPYATHWGPMHWGHVVSKDLVHWEHLPVALEPDHIYDADGKGGGCFSGSGIEKDGKLYLIYTGHVDLPVISKDYADRIESQNVAVSDDGINFTKIDENPVIYAPKVEGVSQSDFRDPKVWQHDGKYYAIVGSRTPTEDPAGTEANGQIVMFESNDLINWNYKNIIARGEGNQGFMWECPNFATIDGQDVLIFSPQGVKPEGNKYLNWHQSVYMLGNLNYETGIFTHGNFDILDYGFDFYAPQITQTLDGRTVLIGWLDMWAGTFPEDTDGWACQMTVPRELHVKDGKLLTTPVKELETLRKSETSYQNLTITKKSSLKNINGATGELITTIDAKNSFDIELRSGGSEKTVLSYNAQTNIFKINRAKSGVFVESKNMAGMKTVEREVKLNPADEIKLQIFLDRSSIEVFINDGEAVMSTRVYPKNTSTGINFVPQKGKTMEIKEITFYTLGEGIPQPAVK